MHKKHLRIVLFALATVLLAAVVLSACVPGGLSEGINEDTRKFSKMGDSRKYAEVEDYAGYLFYSAGETMAFRLKTPEQAAEGENYPLVIFLHGSRDWGSDNRKQMYRSLITSVEKYVDEPCYVLMPQTPQKKSWTDDERGVSELYNKMLDAVLEEYAIDQTRIYLTGMSMGGFGTFFQLNHRPELYAAGMPLCGGPPFFDLSRLTEIPIWVAHSDDDPSVDSMYSRYAVAELLRLGSPSVRWTWYEEEGHQITQVFYDDPAVWQWLFAQQK